MKSIHAPTLKELLEELAIYTVLMVAYTALILQFLIQPIYTLYLRDTLLYTFVALTLILGQGVIMENVATFLREKIEID